ncbi:MAG TPA: carboxypeptidase M32 [Kofleriaceae bacterium]|nr:carboxypeptidase M32 [Kofleriaceae bacterium]
MDADFEDLVARLAEIDDVQSSVALLGWDQATYMPTGGAAARGRQLATLEQIAHARQTDPALARLLDRAQPAAAREGEGSFAARLVRAARRDVERATKVPAAFVGAFAAHNATLYERWTHARPASDFAAVAPLLARSVELSREYAGFFAPYDHVADPLIDLTDPGVRAADVRAVFTALRAELVPLVEAITSAAQVDDRCLRQHFPEEEQLAFGLAIAARFGYDLARGRQDRTPHPFMTKFSLGDVRITTRVRADYLSEALFSTLHEAGHALYEQHIDPRYEATPLAQGSSMGVHESQSRLWENLVGRSLPFWRGQYPALQAAFPAQLGAVPLDAFYRAINRVERSTVRTAADEVTYGLHVIMRFDFELELLEGKLAVADLPEAWRERARRDLGVAPETDRDGCLQDVHWFGGHVGGAFQSYALGNLMSAQFFEAALRAHPEIPQEIEAGRFDTLRSWLAANIYVHGRARTPDELVRGATGKPLEAAPYLRYLRTKYGEIYGL